MKSSISLIIQKRIRLIFNQQQNESNQIQSSYPEEGLPITIVTVFLVGEGELDAEEPPPDELLRGVVLLLLLLLLLFVRALSPYLIFRWISPLTGADPSTGFAGFPFVNWEEVLDVYIDRGIVWMDGWSMVGRKNDD